jgi:hypothetical protein
MTEVRANLRGLHGILQGGRGAMDHTPDVAASALRRYAAGTDERHRTADGDAPTLDARGIRSPHRGRRVPERRTTGAARRIPGRSRTTGRAARRVHPPCRRRVTPRARRWLADRLATPHRARSRIRARAGRQRVRVRSGCLPGGHPSAPLLVVEVADTSYRIDHEFKTSLYARAGVPECWIIDISRAIVEVHRAPGPSEAARYRWRYASLEALQPPATITPLLAPTTAITVADLLP